MPGMVFMATRSLSDLVAFYTDRLQMEVWLRQEDCTILRYDNLYLGFCQRDRADTGGIITLWFDSNEEVDEMYAQLADLAEGAPVENEKYRIYHFFLRDPEGRLLEIQRFEDL